MDQISHDPFAEDSASGTSGEDAAYNRNESRDSLFLMADYRLQGASEIQHVRVRNLSSGGLMAEIPAGLAQGELVEFDVRGIGWVGGKVAWSAAGRVGVAFDRVIDPMLARKPIGGGSRAPVQYRPSLIKK
jgi:hypothetical protein